MASDSHPEPLGEVATIIMGQSPPGDTYNGVAIGVPLLNGPTEFGPSHPTVTVWTTEPTRVCRPGDLLFCVRGATAGRMNWADRPYCLGRGVAAIRGHAGFADTRFIHYALTHSLSELLSRSVGSVFPNISRTDLATFHIPWPDEPTRTRVVSLLGALDDKIELNRRMPLNLEAAARAIFKSWFVNFDPVHAKMEGHQAVGMDAETAALFPDSFEHSSLGAVPSGWKVADIYEVAQVCYGAPYSSALFNSIRKGMPLIRIRDVATQEPSVYTTEAHPRDVVIEPGDVVVGMDGEFGVHIWRGPRSLLNQRVCTFRPKVGVPRAFVTEVIREPLKFFESSKSGTTVIHLGKADIDTFRIIVPPHDVLRAFSEITEPMVAWMVADSGESRTLAELRDSLLSKLLSGEVSVA